MTFLDAKTARVCCTILAFALALWMSWTLRELVFLLLLGLFLAYTIEPLIGYLRRIAPRSISRNLAIVVVFVAVLALVSVAAAWLGRRVAEQAVALMAKLPDLSREPTRFSGFPLPEALEPFRDDVLKFGMDLVQQVAGSLLSGLGGATLFILVPIFALYFLKDGPLLRDGFLAFFAQFTDPAGLRGLFGEFHDLLSKYIRALLLLSLLVFAVYTVFYQVAGVPYALLLATLAALLEIIPIAGWISAAGISTLIAAFSGYPHWGWMLIFYLVFRVVQDYVFVPYLMSEGIELHAIVVLAGVIAGELLGGVPGMFLSIPALAAARILWRHFYRV